MLLCLLLLLLLYVHIIVIYSVLCCDYAVSRRRRCIAKLWTSALEVVLVVVKRNGFALLCAAEPMKVDKDVALAVVTQWTCLAVRFAIHEGRQRFVKRHQQYS